jgi:hypothetical protein
MICYKLFRLRKDNTLGSLFINRKDVIPVNKWIEAQCYPTKGYKVRPGWHATKQPKAPHLSEKNRVWRKVGIKDYEKIIRPDSQGGVWFIAKKMKVMMK